VTVRAFDKAVLVRGVSPGRVDLILKFGKDFVDARVIKQFTTLIQVDIFVFYGGARRVTFEKGAKPVDGCSLTDSGFSMETTGEMVTNKDIGGLAVETSVTECTSFVLGLLPSKSEIDAKALVGDGSCAGRVGARRTFLHLGGKANGTGVKDRSRVFEARNTVNVFVSIVEVLITHVVKALVPEEVFSVSVEFLNLKFRWHICPIHVTKECMNNSISGGCGVSARTRGAGKDDGSSVEEATRDNAMKVDIVAGA
jgi:hypothetical protein